MAVRAVRGATQLDEDVREHMLERVAEMVTDVMAANDLAVDDFISVIFTATSDLVAEFPAQLADVERDRRLGHLQLRGGELHRAVPDHGGEGPQLRRRHVRSR